MFSVDGSNDIDSSSEYDNYNNNSSEDNDSLLQIANEDECNIFDMLEDMLEDM